MDAQIINFKRYDSGAMVGFFDLVVGGIVVTGCKCFRKDDRIWFAWPSEKLPDANGETKFRDIVTAADPIMRHLQNVVRGALRAAIDAKPGAVGNHRAASAPARSARLPFRTPEGEDLSGYRSEPGEDIPF